MPLFAATTAVALGANHFGLEPQPVALQSTGPIAFGPEHVLFVGDPKAAVLYAIDMEEAVGSTKVRPSDWATATTDDFRLSVAKAAGDGTAVDDVQIIDLEIDPESGHAIAAVSVSQRPLLVHVMPDGVAKVVSLDKVLASQVSLPDPPADKVTGEGRRASNKRMESITDLAFTEGRVLASGLTGGDAASTVLAFDFPLRESSVGTDLEIYHGAHGRVEGTAAVRSFVPMTIDGKASLLAGFTCTPLVQFSLADLQTGAKVRGKTVAELGNWNRPLDMIAYEKEGHPYLLVANTARGLMKVDVGNVAAQEAINEPVPDGGTKGLPFEKLDAMVGVVQLAKVGDSHCLVLSESPTKELRLATIELP